MTNFDSKLPCVYFHKTNCSSESDSNKKQSCFTSRNIITKWGRLRKSLPTDCNKKVKDYVACQVSRTNQHVAPITKTTKISYHIITVNQIVPLLGIFDPKYFRMYTNTRTHIEKNFVNIKSSHWITINTQEVNVDF